MKINISSLVRIKVSLIDMLIVLYGIARRQFIKSTNQDNKYSSSLTIQFNNGKYHNEAMSDYTPLNQHHNKVL